MDYISVFTNGSFSSDIVTPIESDVRLGVQYGLDGTQYTGTLLALKPINPGGPIVGDKLTVIQNGLITMVESMRNLDGFNYDYLSTQQMDLNKVTSYPHINIYMVDAEDNLDEPEMVGMNSLRNEAIFELHCYAKLSAEDSNAVFSNDFVLNNMLHDVKKVIGMYPTGEGLWEYIMYDGSRRVRSGQGDDIFIPKYLIVNVRISYTQDLTEPNNNAYV